MQCTAVTLNLYQHNFRFSIYNDFLNIFRSKNKCFIYRRLDLEIKVTNRCMFYTAYGSSQTRSRTGATAAGLHHDHSNTGSELRLWPQHRSRQCQILNPLSEARDWTWIFLDTRLDSFPLCYNENSLLLISYSGTSSSKICFRNRAIKHLRKMMRIDVYWEHTVSL